MQYQLQLDPRTYLDSLINRDVDAYGKRLVTEGLQWKQQAGDPLTAPLPYTYQHWPLVGAKHPSLREAAWFGLMLPRAQTHCERVNKYARHVQGLWRGGSMKAESLEGLVVAYAKGKRVQAEDAAIDEEVEAAAQAAAIDAGGMVLNGEGELVEVEDDEGEDDDDDGGAAAGGGAAAVAVA